MNLFPEGIPVSKRLFDLLLTCLGMVILLPVMGVVYVLVRIKIGKPVFFHQMRPGYHGMPFRVTKFRTMRDTRDEEGSLLPDEERLTSLGKILRAASLDELPEFFKVLRGQMSLVGPRPLLMHYLELYSVEQARRQDVLPGITGWAQVSGRNVLSWDDKFRLDVWYVDNWSLGLDIKILALTFWKVITREGISQPGHATSEEFKGSQ